MSLGDVKKEQRGSFGGIYHKVEVVSGGNTNTFWWEVSAYDPLIK